MEKKKEKGFTLVELLAVVVILVIIVLIALNAFIPITQKARKKAFIDEIEVYVKGADAFYSAELLNGTVDECSASSYGYTECIIDINKLKGEYVDKMANDNLYNGCVYFKMSGDSNVDYFVSMSNGSFKYTGTATNIKEDLVNLDSTIAKCEDIDDNIIDDEGIPEEDRAYLLKRQGAESIENYYSLSDKILEINFVNHKNHGAEEIDCDDNSDLKWCVAQSDASKNRTRDDIIAWAEPSSNDNSMYVLYIGSDKKIYAPENSSYLFSKFTNLTKISFANFYTANVKNMMSMFKECEKLTELTNMNNFSTRNVTDMNYMFADCKNLTKLDLSSFRTSRVENMSGMFLYCKSLEELKLNNFDTSKVEDMRSMFNGCRSLTKLDLSSFRTSRVKRMSGMFYNCESLTELDLNNFDTSKVEEMSGMFYSCESLTELDLSNFNTSKVKDMGEMFYSCESLIELDLSNFKIPSLTFFDGMFSNCTSLKNLDISDFEMTNVLNSTNYYNLFSNSNNLETIKVKDQVTKAKLAAVAPSKTQFID